MMRNAMRSLMAVAAGLSTLAAAPVAFGQDKITVSVPSPAITAFCMVTRIARHPNYPGPTKKYQLTFEDVAMPIPQVPVNIANNQVNVGECSGISTVLNAWNKGAKNMLVFAFGAESPVWQLIAQPEIKKLSDLKGKVVGIQGIQSAGAEAIEMILKRGANLLPERDYSYVTVGAGTATMAALLAKKIDAIAYFPPFTYELEKRGYPPLADEATYVPKYVTGTHVVSRSWADQNRPLFIRFLKSMIETGDWLKDPANEKEVVAFFRENIEPGVGDGKMDQATAQKTYDLYVKDKRLSFNGYASEEAVRANIDILKERGYITDAEIPPLGQVFDFSYLNQALRELGHLEVKEYAK
jgi:ABC-type nitrate/sulfonate/bicarbonate transport system substrate-binding protein